MVFPFEPASIRQPECQRTSERVLYVWSDVAVQNSFVVEGSTSEPPTDFGAHALLHQNRLINPEAVNSV